MLLRFWENPEFVRHLRAELRPPRAMTVALLTLVIIVLVGLWAWGAEHKNVPAFVKTFHLALVVIQFTLLGFWCASACGQAISREREMKTFDFLKTTRLSAGEILVGKLLGTPMVIYFVIACSLPVSFVTGLLAGYPLSRMVWVVALLAAFGLFVGLIGLCVSMLVQKSGAGATFVVALFPMAWLMAFASSTFPGFSGLSIVSSVSSLYKEGGATRAYPPTVFGAAVPYPPLTVVLYILFGAWFILVLVRNLKKDREQMRLLNRWEAVAFAVFLNILFYAFLDPNRLAEEPRMGIFPPEHVSPEAKDVSALAAGLNGVMMFLLGIATLTPRERLKVWWRKRGAAVGSYFAPDAPSWPFLALMAAVAYALLAAEGLGLSKTVPLSEWRLGLAALQMLAVLAYVVRDVLFLQWCLLTRLKRPIFKGLLYLVLYYTTVGIVGFVLMIVSRGTANFFMGMLTPWMTFEGPYEMQDPTAGLYPGLILQAALISLLLRAISTRLSRPPVAPAPSPATT